MKTKKIKDGVKERMKGFSENYPKISRTLFSFTLGGLMALGAFSINDCEEKWWESKVDVYNGMIIRIDEGKGIIKGRRNIYIKTYDSVNERNVYLIGKDNNTVPNEFFDQIIFEKRNLEEVSLESYANQDSLNQIYNRALRIEPSVTVDFIDKYLDFDGNKIYYWRHKK